MYIYICTGTYIYIYIYIYMHSFYDPPLGFSVVSSTDPLNIPLKFRNKNSFCVIPNQLYCLTFIAKFSSIY